MSEKIPCKLCGLPVKVSTASRPASSDVFCCNGCKMVYTMIMESDQYKGVKDFKETEIYQRCLAAGIVPATEADIPDRKDAKSQASPAPETGPEQDIDGLLSVSFAIGNMWCPACAWIVENTLVGKEGVVRASCNFSSDRGSVVYDPIKTRPENILKTVRSLGYDAKSEAAGTGKINPEFIRLCVCALLTMNVMMLSWAVYSGFFISLTDAMVQYLVWPVFIMATIVLAYGGAPVFKRALAGIRTGTPGMETLITAGSLTAYLYSLFNFAVGSLHLYFDTASMLIVLVQIGKMLEQNAKNKITAGLAEFFSLAPKKVKICDEAFPDGRYVSVEQLDKGDLFIVDAGEVLAADGRVVEGSAVLDVSSITGEPKPVTVRPGDEVSGGAKVASGTVKVKAMQVGPDSVLGKMMAIMEDGLSKKSGRTKRFEQILKYFVPGIVSLAVLTTLVSYLAGLSSFEAFNRGISVMVISCPCALGIAIPLALVVGVTTAGKYGILVRDYEAFEKAEQLDCIVFDKTGTLTTGGMRLIGMHELNGYSGDEALAMAHALERDSDHYIAQTIRLEPLGTKAFSVENLVQHETGVSGTWNGLELRIGSREFAFGGNGNAGPAISEPEQEPDETAVVTRVFLSVSGKPAARFDLGDPMREGVADLVASLKNKGYRIAMVSGDSKRATVAAAQIAGIDPDLTHGRMLPHEKAERIGILKKNASGVAMVGDGINDAPAMAESDLAVAVSSGLEPGRGVAAITLMRQHPAQLLDFIDLSGRVNRKVKQNLGFAFLYNIIAIPVAAGGLLNPVVAVIAMLLSSLSVTFNTLMLVRRETRRTGR